MTVEGLFIGGVGESTREALAAACPNYLGGKEGHAQETRLHFEIPITIFEPGTSTRPNKV